MKLYIEGVDVDLGNAKIAQTYQVNDIASVDTRQCSYTNQFTLPTTEKNVKLMQALGIAGNTSIRPYRKLSCKLINNGIELMSNGYAQVKSFDGGYQVVIYDGTISIFEAIGDAATLQDLDYSDINHAHTFENIEASFSNTEGYIHAMALWGGFVWYTPITDFYTDYLPASIFIKTLLGKIIVNAGFYYAGEIITDEKFNRTVVPPCIGYNVPLLNVMDYAPIMPAVKQTDFLKDIMQRFGLIFIQDKYDNKITFYFIEDILNDTAGAEDWSDKFVSVKSEDYNPGANYTQKNKFENNYDRAVIEELRQYVHNSATVDLALSQLPDSLNGIATIDNETISSEEKTVVKSPFMAGAPIYEYDGERCIYIIPAFGNSTDGSYGTNQLQPKETKPVIAEVVIHEAADVVLVGSTSLGNDQYPIFGANVPVLGLGVDYQNNIETYYPKYFAMLNRYKKVAANIKLDDFDIANLNFTKQKYIKQLGAYYYLNKVSDYQGEITTEVELIEVK